MNEQNIWREAAAGNVNQVINLSISIGIDAVDQWGWTPLHWACKKNHPLLVTELLRSGANPSITDLVCLIFKLNSFFSSSVWKYASADRNGRGTS